MTSRNSKLRAEWQEAVRKSKEFEASFQQKYGQGTASGDEFEKASARRQELRDAVEKAAEAWLAST